ncbi:set-domain histone methyltransferase-8 [Colletotrichum tabaci]|uniref:Set-domain histone methyltransferase-8 n=1 Tax=Colletotrichum tabaci TaxID=1209068 RepID=A0AAV9SUA0_9PEZI
MRKSTLQKDDGNFVILYDAIDVVEGEMTVNLSAETPMTAESDVFSSDLRAVDDSLGASHQTHYYLETAFGRNPKPGITTSYLYYAKDALTCSGMHLEDLFVPSVNLLRWGAPKAWLVLDPEPTNMKLFEKRVKEFRASSEYFIHNNNARELERTLQHCLL